ncbi:unnamed protein product [Ascophyllum nodosum]
MSRMNGKKTYTHKTTCATLCHFGVLFLICLLPAI